jgi:putative ABC transport system permease protein
MFLALRELQHSRLRYLLLGTIIALIAWLVFILSGLANGLANDNAAALLHMPADQFVFQSDSRLLLHRSLLPGEAVEQVRRVPGVADAAPLGHLSVTVAREGGGERLDATILAIDPASFLAPPIVEGRALAGAPAGGVVVDRSLSEHGVRVGDQLLVLPAGQTLTVVGFTEGQTYSHAPVIFLDMQGWRQLKFAAPGSAGQVIDPISAVAVRGGDEAAGRIAEALPGVEVASRDATVQQLPGYKEEMGTITMMLVFLFIIAAFVLAVFFYVITLQKSNQFGILKALGAGTAFLARDLVGQVLLLTAIGVASGVLLTYGVAAVIPSTVPFALSGQLVALYSVVLLAVALAGTLLSLRRVAAIDPLMAIGRMD